MHLNEREDFFQRDFQLLIGYLKWQDRAILMIFDDIE